MAIDDPLRQPLGCGAQAVLADSLPLELPRAVEMDDQRKVAQRADGYRGQGVERKVRVDEVDAGLATRCARILEQPPRKRVERVGCDLDVGRRVSSRTEYHRGCVGSSRVQGLEKLAHVAVEPT